MSSKQILGLAKYSHQKKLEAALKTEEAIKSLINKKQKITIRSVAKEAGVSVSYIYKYPELSYKIQTLREQQKYSLVSGDRSTKNIDNQVKKLEREKIGLRREIEQLKDYIKSLETGQNSSKNLQIENIQLKTENQQLKRELEYTKQNLQSAREFILAQGHDAQEQSEIVIPIELTHD